MTWTTLFVHYLREYGIGLHITQLNDEIDLFNHFEVSQLWVLAMAAELEWASSRDRMHTALSRQMRDAGKGWGGTGSFGFTRDDESFVVVDEPKWSYVLLIHELYASTGKISSVAAASSSASRYGSHAASSTRSCATSATSPAGSRPRTTASPGAIASTRFTSIGPSRARSGAQSAAAAGHARQDDDAAGGQLLRRWVVQS